MDSNAIDLFPRFKDGGDDGGDESIIDTVKITMANNGYCVEIEFYDGERFVELTEDLEVAFEWIRNLDK